MRDALAVAALLAMLPGCVSYDSTLSIDPYVTVHATAPADQPVRVHVGQPITFTFDIDGPADHAEVFFGSAAPPATIQATGEGRFRFNHTFDRPTDPDRPITVVAVAYLVRGRQDRMFINGEAIVRDQRDDVHDRRCASSEIEVCVYQAHIEVTLPAAADPYNWASARLIIQRADGQETVIYYRQGQVRGFVPIGPDHAGRYVITYRPRYDEIDPAGPNHVVFSARDRTGQLRSWQATVSTSSSRN